MAITSLYCPSCGAHNALDADTCFACQHPLHEPVREPLLHNRYRLLDQLGSGGFGAVHRAEDTQENNRVVAIKQINLAGLTPQQVIEATDGFNREVSLLSTLSHSHLPHIYEHFTDPDHWYLVMDFLEGETLETYLDKNYMRRGMLSPLPLTEILDIGLQLCNVLDYLHSREPTIIFRDVKPANVMRTPTGKLYLIDFGIARHYKPGKPKDTIPFGSPGYAAPEQYGKAQTTPRSDIYSLGALLHMLLSGNDPVDNPFHFDPLRLYGAEGINDLMTLIERMVTLDIEQRPQSIQDVKDTLQTASDAQNHVRILPVNATPPPSPTPVVVNSGNGLQQMMVQRQQLRKQRQQYWSYNRRKSRRGFVLGTASAVGGLALAFGGLAALTRLARNGMGASNGMPVSGVATSPDALFQTPLMLTPKFSDGQGVQCVSWSANGNIIALVGGSNVRVQQLDTSNVTGLHKILAMQRIAHPIDTLRWQPSNEKNIALSTDDTLYLWKNAPGNTNPAVLYQQQSGTAMDANVSLNTFAWSPDGKRIAIPFAEGVRIWDVATKTLFRNVLFNDVRANLDKQMPVSSLTWSPDGGFIAAGLNGSSPMVWDVNTGIAYLLDSDTLHNAKLVTWSPSGNFIASSLGNTIHVAAFDAINGLPFNVQQNTITPVGGEQISYTGHRGTVTSLVWSPDGRYIASGSGDKENNLHVWSPFSPGNGIPPLVNPRTLFQPQPDAVGNNYIFHTTLYQGHTGINAICWSPNGLNLLVGSDNAYVIGLDTAMM